MVATLAIRDFSSAEEMMEYYRVTRAKLRPPSKPVTFKITPKKLPPIAPVLLAPPPPPPNEPIATPIMLTTIEADSQPWPEGHTPTVEEFLDAVSKRLIFGSRANALRLARLLEMKYRLEKDALISDRRYDNVVRVRQEWYWCLVRVFGMPNSKVAKMIGRDHTTIMHGVKVHEKRMGS